MKKGRNKIEVNYLDDKEVGIAGFPSHPAVGRGIRCLAGPGLGAEQTWRKNLAPKDGGGPEPREKRGQGPRRVGAGLSS